MFTGIAIVNSCKIFDIISVVKKLQRQNSLDNIDLDVKVGKTTEKHPMIWLLDLKRIERLTLELNVIYKIIYYFILSFNKWILHLKY